EVWNVGGSIASGGAIKAVGGRYPPARPDRLDSPRRPREQRGDAADRRFRPRAAPGPVPPHARQRRGDEVTAGQVVATISSPETEAQLRAAQAGAIQSVAPSLGIELRPVNVRDADEIERSIAAFAQGSNGALRLWSLEPPEAAAVMFSVHKI